MNEGLGEVWFVRANARRNSHCVPTHDRTLARPGRDCTFLFAANGPQGRRPGEQDLPLAGIAGKRRGLFELGARLARAAQFGEEIPAHVGAQWELPGACGA